MAKLDVLLQTMTGQWPPATVGVWGWQEGKWGVGWRAWKQRGGG